MTLIVPSAARAQTTDSQAKTPPNPATAPAPAKAGVDEIVVTARKKVEALQDTPIAVTALTGEKLDAQQVTNLSEVASFSPNVQFDTSAPLAGSSSAASIYIRGIGSSEFALSADPGVAIYLDGVYLARSLGAVLDLVDPERVEVLRGPQGTLFGRNAVGGAINIISRTPETELGGNLKATIGSDDLVRYQGTLNLPMGETMRSRVSFLTSKRDGYVKNLADSFSDAGDEDRWALHGSLQWDVSPSLTLTFAGDATQERQQPAPNVLVGIAPFVPAPPGAPAAPLPPGAPPLPPGTQPSFVLISNLLNGCLVAPNPNCFDGRFLNGPHATSGGFNSNTPQVNSALSKPQQPRSDLDVWGTSVTADWEMSSNLTVRSITSYRRLDSFIALDGDHTPITILGDNGDFEQEQTTQELQLLGNAMGGALDFVLGGYYFDEDGKHIDVVEFPFAAIRSGGAFDSRSVAGFGQATYNFSPKLQMTLGLRYSYEKKLFDVEGQRALTAPPPGLLPFPLVPGQRLVLGEDRASNRDGAFTPLVSMSYFFSDEVMTYASYSEGFKSGGFEQRIFPPAQFVPKFDQEKVRVYEVGAKTLLLDNRLRLNTAVFFSDYDDLQISLFDGIAPVTRNAAQAEIKGIELEGQLKPTPEMNVDFGFGYLDSRYTDLSLQNLGVDRSDKFVNSPTYSASAGLSYTFELGGYGALTARGGWSFRSDVANDAVNTAVLEQNKLSLYDASLSWDSMDAKWRVTLSGKNLGDREFIIAGSNIVLSGVTEATFDRGRTWALSVERQF